MGAEYQNGDYDPVRLTMLGVKSTCNDRWRQLLAEAKRFEGKHLLALGAGFWSTKAAGSVERDAKNRQALAAAGWKLIVIWECQTRDANLILRRLKNLKESV